MYKINLFFVKYHLFIVYIVLLNSFLIKYMYVFYFTEYTSFLYSDMAGYWQRAIHSSTINDTDSWQWMIWPPFGHMTLAWFFKVLYVLGLDEQKLQFTVLMNIVLSSLSTWFVYLIARKTDASKNYALIIVCVYAFFFPLIYLNAFVLSEHLSLFALLLSIVLLFYMDIKSSISVIIIGVVLAFSVAMRPAFGVVGLVFFFYILFHHGKISLFNFTKATLFSLGFFFFLAFVSIGNYYNSHGKLKTLSANGGLTFYFSQCKMYKVESRSEGYTSVIVPPITAGYPENGTLNTNIPFYQQGYFYKEGFKCLEKNDHFWVDNLYRFKYLYFDSMFPADSRAKFYSILFPLFSKWAFVLTLILVFYPLLFLDKNVHKNKIVFLMGIIFVQVCVLYFFQVEQRYLYGFFFSILLLSILVIVSMIRNFKSKSKTITLYMAVVGIALVSYGFGYKTPIKKSVTMTIYQDSEYIKTLHQTRHTRSKFEMKIHTINFKSSSELEHFDLGLLGFKDNFFIDFSAQFIVKKGKNITFIVASDDGFSLDLDKINILSYESDRPVGVNRKTIFIKGGKHQLEMSYFQGMGDLALRAFYVIDGKRYLWGQDSKYLEFI